MKHKAYYIFAFPIDHKFLSIMVQIFHFKGLKKIQKDTTDVQILIFYLQDLINKDIDTLLFLW